MTHFKFSGHTGQAETVNVQPNMAEQVINQVASTSMDASENEKQAEESKISPFRYPNLREQISWGRNLRRLQEAIKWQPCNSTSHYKWWQFGEQKISYNELWRRAIGRMAYALMEGCFPRVGNHALLPLGMGDLISGNSLYLSVSRVAEGERWQAGKMCFQAAGEKAYLSPLLEWDYSPEKLFADATLFTRSSDLVRYCELEEIGLLRSALLRGWYSAKHCPESVIPEWEWTYQDLALHIPVQWNEYTCMEVLYLRRKSREVGAPVYRFLRLM